MAGAPEDYAVQEPIRDDASREISLGPDPLSEALRSDLRDRMERIIREELYAALGAGPYERTPERRGYLHSPRERTLTTAEGTATIMVPRGRVFKPEGGRAVWLRVRLAKKIEKLPVAVAVGVREDGTKMLLGLWAYASEGRAAWGGVLEDLAARGLPIPALVVIDGSKGLRGAVSECWPQVAVQRCTVHKLRNLEAHAPKRLHDELREDYREIVYAEDEKAARRAWLKFTTQWKKRCPAVVESLGRSEER